MNIKKFKIPAIFYADLRSLAAFRVGLAIVIIIKVFYALQGLKLLYSDEGVFPREIVNKIDSIHYLSLYNLSGNWQFGAFLLILTFIFSIMLLIGYKTRIAAISLFILLVSLNGRTPDLIHGADFVITVLLFWGILIPWNARFSIDSIGDIALRKLPNSVFSFGILGYFLQIGFIYFFAGVAKSGPQWTTYFNAIYLSMSSIQYTSYLSQILLLLPNRLLMLLTYSVRMMELSVIFLLFFPHKNVYVRTAIVGALIIMQASFGFFLSIGLLPLVNIAGLLGLIPSFVWDKILNFLDKKGKGLKIYYDSECGFCIWFVTLLKTFFLTKSVELIYVKNGKFTKVMNKYNSWIVVDKGDNRYLKSKGIIPILKNSPILFIFYPLIYLPGIFKAGDKLYEIISSRRHLICKIPVESNNYKVWDFSKIANILAIISIILMVFININTRITHFKSPETISRRIGLYQNWGFFAPRPPIDDKWFDMYLNYNDKTKKQVLSRSSFISKDNDFTTVNLMKKLSVFPGLATFYADYLCKKENGKVSEVEMYYKIQRIPLKNEVEPPIFTQRKIIHYCKRV